MSLFAKRAKRGPMTAGELIPGRPMFGTTGPALVTTDTALRHSAVWACIRLRANLISTFPVDVYRKVLGISVEVTKPTILVTPGGERVDIQEWLYSTQVDLDRVGNCFGLITERDGLGFPARIDLQPANQCTVIMRDGKLKYRIAGVEYNPDLVWHEKQYTVAGLPFGLSPVAYAAWSIGEYLSIQDFATNWFGTGGIPKAHLKNSEKTLTFNQSEEIKLRYKESVTNGDVWVTGNDWTFEPIAMEAEGQNWIDAKQFGIQDTARFFDCPGDLIDAMVSGSSITYANIAERNLQFLIYHLGPAIARREAGLNRLLPKPRFMKLNTSSLLRMDDKNRALAFKTQIDSRTIAPSEVRAIEDRQPFTPAQIKEFETFWPAKKAEPNGSKESDKPEETDSE